MESKELEKETIEAAMALCKIQESVDRNTDRTRVESSYGFMDIMLAPPKLVGGWVGWMFGFSNDPVDIANVEKELEAGVSKFLMHFDGRTLAAAEIVCKKLYNIVCDRMLWKMLIQSKVKTDTTWRRLAEEEGWIQYLFDPSGKIHPENTFYRNLFLKVSYNINDVNNIWLNRTYNLRRIRNCKSTDKGIYCLQYDEQKIIAGSRDHSIKFWDPNTLICTKVLTGHEGSILCLQYDDKVIISGSSDNTVRIWDVVSGKLLNTLTHHTDSVLSLKFYNDVLVTSCKDSSIAVWDMKSPTDIQLRRVLSGHRAAVNIVDLDEKYIVSASGDRKIKVWNTSTCEFVRNLTGHKRGIACLQYRYPLIVTGSSDNDIRIWNVESIESLRVLSGHESLVRCIRFDSNYIVSGDYKGKIKVWDLKGALDLEKNAENLCLRTFKDHAKRVMKLQFDDAQIVSASLDDTILIRDFQNDNINEKDAIVLQNNIIESNNQDDKTSSSPVTNEDDGDFVIID